MTLWTAYLLGAVTALVGVTMLWVMFRIAEPWIMSRSAAVQIGFAHIWGMRLRKADPLVVVSALIVLTKSDEPMFPFKLEAIYHTLPERSRSVDDLVSAAREHTRAESVA